MKKKRKKQGKKCRKGRPAGGLEKEMNRSWNMNVGLKCTWIGKTISEELPR